MIDRIVRVEWLDHTAASLGWSPREKMVRETLDLCVTVGRVIAEHADRIVIAGSWCDHPNYEDVSGVSVIARVCIQRIEVLMPGKSPGPSVKKPSTYEALRKKGMPKSSAAAIANDQAKKDRQKRNRKSR